jgi:hypothetical protein
MQSSVFTKNFFYYLFHLSENAAWSESKIESPNSKTQKTPGGVVLVELTK